MSTEPISYMEGKKVTRSTGQRQTRQKSLQLEDLESDVCVMLSPVKTKKSFWERVCDFFTNLFYRIFGGREKNEATNDSSSSKIKKKTEGPLTSIEIKQPKLTELKPEFKPLPDEELFERAVQDPGYVIRYYKNYKTSKIRDKAFQIAIEQDPEEAYKYYKATEDKEVRRKILLTLSKTSPLVILKNFKDIREEKDFTSMLLKEAVMNTAVLHPLELSDYKGLFENEQYHSEAIQKSENSKNILKTLKSKSSFKEKLDSINSYMRNRIGGFHSALDEFNKTNDYGYTFELMGVNSGLEDSKRPFEFVLVNNYTNSKEHMYVGFTSLELIHLEQIESKEEQRKEIIKLINEKITIQKLALAAQYKYQKENKTYEYIDDKTVVMLIGIPEGVSGIEKDLHRMKEIYESYGAKVVSTCMQNEDTWASLIGTDTCVSLSLGSSKRKKEVLDELERNLQLAIDDNKTAVVINHIQADGKYLLIGEERISVEDIAEILKKSYKGKIFCGELKIGIKTKGSEDFQKALMEHLKRSNVTPKIAGSKQEILKEMERTFKFAIDNNMTSVHIPWIMHGGGKYLLTSDGERISADEVAEILKKSHKGKVFCEELIIVIKANSCDSKDFQKALMENLKNSSVLVKKLDFIAVAGENNPDEDEDRSEGKIAAHSMTTDHSLLANGEIKDSEELTAFNFYYYFYYYELLPYLHSKQKKESIALETPLIALSQRHSSILDRCEKPRIIIQSSHASSKPKLLPKEDLKKLGPILGSENHALQFADYFALRSAYRQNATAISFSKNKEGIKKVYFTLTERQELIKA